ncbi:MAG: YhgE/Pip domain-containing protein, partial [Lachnospiraceae bacterium]|nr:YhgE/Pip domain-containing protein [Lachnospiraceae bacterium]
IVFVVIIGIAILPALYSWFNIVANWDPYSNTAGLDFAVCNLDKGYEYKGIDINAGDKIVDNLKANPKMGWDFVSEKKARDGVKNGKYFATVIIPADFSENLFSVTTGGFDQAKIQYYSNEKKNAIAPKITDKGAEAIENAVKSAYVDKLTEVLAAAMNITESELSDNKEEAAKKVTDALENAKGDIEDFRVINELFITTLDSVEAALKSNKDLEIPIKDSLSKAGVIEGDIKNTVDNLRNSSDQISGSVSEFIKLSDSYATETDDMLKDAFDDLETDSDSAANKLDKVKTINQKIIDVNNISLNILKKIKKAFPDLKLDKVTSRLEKSNEKQEAIIKKIERAVKIIKRDGKLPNDLKKELETYVSDSKSIASNGVTDFKDIKDSIDKTIDDTYSVMDDISGFAVSLGSGKNSLKNVINSGLDTVKALKKTFKGVDKILDNTEEKIGKLEKKVSDAKNNDKLESLILPIIEKPEALGNFIANPVATNKHRVYPIENYGSAMTPFYTSLGLWVGGVVLVAVIAASLNKKEDEELENPRPHEVYFGRYLIFFVMGQIQALVISLGDLWFLKIQCKDPFLFVLASMISSFVFTLIIYSLTITFSVLGKALSVIILVIQVAGSGGTFPVEVLPYPFQVMAPYLPFHYGINAMREAVAGVDPAAYWRNIGILALFALFGLFVGLVLRKPCIGVIEFFNKRIEDSDLIV